MSLEIEVSVEEAQRRVKALGENITELGTVAQGAARKIKDELGLDSSIASSYSGLLKEFAALRREMDQFAAIGKEATSVMEGLSGKSLQIVNTMQKATAAHRRQVEAMDAQAKQARELAEQTGKSSKATAEAAALDVRAAKVRSSLATSTDKLAAATAEINALKEKGKLSAGEDIALLQKAAAKYGEVTSKVQQYIATLQKQQSEFGKTSVQLLRMKEGWSDLDGAQQKSAVATVRLSDSLKNVAGYYRQVETPVGSLIKKLADLRRVQEAGLATEAQHAEALKNIRRELLEEVTALQRVAAAKNKNAQEVNVAKENLLSYVRATEKANAEFGKTKTQLDQTSQAWTLLGAVEKMAYLSQTRLASAIKLVGPLLAQKATAAEQANEKLAALDLILKKGKTSQEAYAKAVKQVKDSLKPAATEVEKYLDSLQKQRDVFGKSQQDLLKMKDGWSALSPAQKKAASESVALSEALKLVGPLLSKEATAAEQAQQKIAALGLVLKSGTTNQEAYARAVKAVNESLKPATTEVEKYLAGLRKQKDVFGKTKQELLTMKEGWSQLSPIQQVVAQSAVRVSEAMERSNGVLQKTLTSTERYKQAIADLDVLLSARVISEQQYLRAVELTNQALSKTLAAEAKAAESKVKSAKATKTAKEELLSYVAKLNESNAAMGKTDIEILRLSKGFDALSKEQKEAAEDAVRFASTMKSVGNIIEAELAPVDKYRRQIEALTRAQREYQKTGGQRGISKGQYDAGVLNANKDLKENLTRANEASKAMRAYSTSLGVGNQAAAAFRATLSGTGQSIGFFSAQTLLAATAAYTISKALASSITKGAEFEATFERAAIVMGEFNGAAANGFGALTVKAEMVKRKVIELAKQTQYGTVEVAKAAEVLAQAGLAPVQVFNALGPALNLATIGMVDVAEAADIAVGVMYGFGLQSKDLERVVDVMAKTTVSTNVTLKQLSKSMTYAAPVAHQMGLEIEDLAASLATLANANIKGSMAGTTTRRILTSLAAPTTAAGKAFKELGINVENYMKGGTLELQRLFTDLEKKGASLAQMKDIYGQWAISAALRMKEASKAAKDGTKTWADYRKEMEDVAGTSEQMATDMKKNLTQAFENLRSTFEAIQTTSFDGFGQNLETQVRRLTAFLEANATQIATVLSSIMNSMINIGAWLVEWGSTLGQVALVYTSFKLGQVVIGALMGVMAKLVVSSANAARAGEANAVITGKQTSAYKLFMSSLGQVLVGQAALERSTVALDVIKQNDIRLTTQQTLANDLAAIGAVKNGAAVGTGAALAATGTSRLMTVAKGAMGFLLGWGGVLVTLAAVFLPDFISALSKAEEPVFHFTGALEDFKIGMEEVTNGYGVMLDTFSQKNLLQLGENLEKDLKTAQVQLDYTAEKAKEAAKAFEDLKKAQPTSELKLFGGLFSTGWGEITPKDLDAAMKQVEERAKANTEAFNLYRTAADAVAVVMGKVTANAVLMSIEKQKAKETTFEGMVALKEYKQELLDTSLAMLYFVSAMVAFTEQNTLAKTAFEGLLKPFGDSANAIRSISLYVSALQGLLQAKKDSAIPPPEPVGPDKGLADAAEAAKAAATALEGYIKAFETGTGSVAGLKRELKELADNQAFLASGSAEASAKLKEMGYSAEDAKKALEFNETSKLTEYLSKVLGETDVRFKELGKSVESAGSQALNFDESMQLAREALLLLNIPAAEIEQLLSRLAPGMEAVATGTAAATREFETLRARVSGDWAAAMNPDDLDSLADRYAESGKYSREAVVQTLAQERALKLLGSAMEDTYSESETLEMAFRAATLAAGKNTKELARLMKGYKALEESLPTGQLLKSNENIRNQIAISGQGADALELYNAAWEATNGHLEQTSDAFIRAKQENILLNEQLKQIQEVQAVYQQFGEGVAQLFTDLFTGQIKSLKDFVGRVKDMFKQMIADLLLMAIRNSLMKALFNTGGGNSQGFFAAIQQGVAGLFGGGQGQQGSNPLSLIASAVQGTAGGGSSAGSTGGLNLGSLVQNAIGNATGLTGSASSTGSAGTNWLSMLGNSGGLTQSQGAQGVLGRIGGFFGAPGGSFVSGAPGGGVGANFVGPIHPSGTPAAGTMGGILGGITGLYAGSQAGSGGLSTVASTATYGLGGAALGAGLSSVLAGGSFFAGGSAALTSMATAAGASAGAAAAIPVIGWIAAAVMLLNQFTGGKVFGTKYRTESVSENISLANGGTASIDGRQVRQRSLFRGRQWRNVALDVPDEMTAAAKEFFEAIETTLNMTARELKTNVPEMVDAIFTTKTNYDKKGKETGKTTTGVINGVTYANIEFEEFQKRVHAESMIKVVQESVKDIFNQALNRDPQAFTQLTDEVDNIADRWRGNAEKLVEGASLLVAIQNDIVDGNNLLGEVQAGTMTSIVDLVEDYGKSNESLADTYIRIRDTVKAVEESLGAFGLSAGKTREEFVRFSLDLVEALGGLDLAKEKLTVFIQAFGELGAMEYATTEARRRRSESLTAIGLDPGTSASQFQAAYGQVANSLDAEETANWINAGYALAAVSVALEDMRKTAFDLQETLPEQIDKQIAGIRALGASEEELAQAREYGNMIIKRALDDFMAGIEGSLAKFEGRENVAAFNAVRRAMADNMKQARLLGASTQQLARIQQLAAYQMQEIITNLRNSITSLRKELYKKEEEEDKEKEIGTSASILALQASQVVTQAQIDLFEAAKSAIERITDFLNELEVGDLSIGDWTDRLGSAKDQFTEMFARAQAGDPDALNGIVDAAKTYLQLARQYYGSTVDYSNIYNFVTDALRGLRGTLLGIGDPGTGGEGGGGESGGSSSSSSSTVRDPAEIKAERFQLALQLAQSLGELGILLETNVFDLMKEYNVSVTDLALDLGIDIKDLQKDMVDNIQLMAGALGIGVQDLLTKLGVTSDQLAEAFGIKLDEFNKANLTNVTALSEALGLSIYETMTMLGISLTDMAAGFGVNVSDMNATTLAGIVEMAGAMKVSVSELIGKLGIDITALATSFGINAQAMSDADFAKMVEFARLIGTDILTLGTTIGANMSNLGIALAAALSNSVTEMPELPDDLKNSLGPYLQAIKDADSSAAVNTAIGNLLQFTQTLPEAQKTALTSLFTSLGIDVVKGLQDVEITRADFQRRQLNNERDIVDNTQDIVDVLEDDRTAWEEVGFPALGDIRNGIYEMVAKLTPVPPSPDSGTGAAIEPPDSKYLEGKSAEATETNRQLVSANKQMAKRIEELTKQVEALTRITQETMNENNEHQAQAVRELKKANIQSASSPTKTAKR